MTDLSRNIRLMLVEDQALVRDALRQLLALQSDITIVATAANGLEAMPLIESLQPELVLTDIEMPHMDGLSLCEWVKQNQPLVKTAIVTTFNRSGFVQRALQAGALGFILKEVPVDTLTENIRAIASGVRVYDPELVIAGISDQNPLSTREAQALRLAETGLSTTQIASQLHLSEGTVRNYLSECMSKLYANSRGQAARIARDKGWL